MDPETIAQKIKNEEQEFPAISCLSKERKKVVLEIFNHWNSKAEIGIWHRQTKLTFDMVKSITGNLVHYTVRDLKDAIDNYALILQDSKYYWDYIWSLSRFFSVKYEKSKDGVKKWLQFLPENFIESNYRDKSKIIIEKEIETIDDIDPQLTSQLIKSFGSLISNPTYNPSDKDIVKFRKATEQMYLFFGPRQLGKSGWIKLLLGCIERAYDGKTFIYAGSLCSEHTWSYLMPQYLKELGL